MKLRMTHAGGIAAIGAVALAVWLSSGSVQEVSAQGGTQDRPTAQSDAAAQAPAQAWTVNCASQGTTADLVCAMNQVLIARDSGQRIVSASISRNGNSGYVLRLSLPHGILLPEGVALWIDDGQRIPAQIRTADQNGSYASIPLGDDLQGAMRRGRILNVMVKSSNDDEVILQLSLAGFTAAFGKL